MSNETKYKDKVRFEEWADKYDESILQKLVFRASHNMFLSQIVPYYNDRNDIKILDIGCGTGEFIFGLADSLKEAEIHGMDIAFDMAKVAKSKLKDHNIKVKVGDVEHLPYSSSMFDIVTCSHSFHHYPDKKKAVGEMHRVLKDKGRLMIIDGSRDVVHGKIIFNIIGKIEKHVYHMLAHEFRALLTESGFEDVEQRRFNIIPLLLTAGTARK